MILEVVKYGHPILRKKGARINSVTPEIEKFIASKQASKARQRIAHEQWFLLPVFGKELLDGHAAQQGFEEWSVHERIIIAPFSLPLHLCSKH